MIIAKLDDYHHQSFLLDISTFIAQVINELILYNGDVRTQVALTANQNSSRYKEYFRNLFSIVGTTFTNELHRMLAIEEEFISPCLIQRN